MLLIGLVIVLGVWAAAMAVVICLCASAARADRDALRHRQRAMRRNVPALRRMAHR